MYTLTSSGNGRKTRTPDANATASDSRRCGRPCAMTLAATKVADRSTLPAGTSTNTPDQPDSCTARKFAATTGTPSASDGQKRRP